MVDAIAAMGAAGAFETTARAVVAAGLERARPAIDAALAERGLSIQAIDHKDMAGLQTALDDVDELLREPTRLGVFPAFGPDTASGQRRITVGPRPILLDRREYVLRRMAEVESKQGLLDMASSAQTMRADDATSPAEAIASATTQLDDRLTDINRQIKETQEQRAQAIADQITMQTHDMEMAQRRASILQSWLSKDVVAGAAGLLLIAVFGIALVVAMFTGVTATSIVSDSFLLVLGYFFGQATKPGKDKE